MQSPFPIRTLALRNYKSIEQCEIEFTPLTVMVGRNGAGKSNLLDSLRFVAESLQNTLEYAIRERGGIDLVRRKSLGGRPTHPAIGLGLTVDGLEAEYSFRIAAVQGRSFRVDRERCIIRDSSGATKAHFTATNGKVEWSLANAAPAHIDDRLFLVAASGIPEFRPVFDALSRMTFHNLNPEVMKYPQRPEPGERLAHDGHNLASVIKRIEATAPMRMERVVRYLNAIGVPVARVSHKQAGALETIEVAQRMEVPEGQRNARFDAVSLSDGTIRALGILVSLVSSTGVDQAGPTLVGIEEPETALHPAAAAALMDALQESSESTQILLTCHSPDFLDHASQEVIRVVMIENGRTVVGPISPAKATLLREHLATPGELLRLDQLTPDPSEIARQRETRGTLFEEMV